MGTFEGLREELSGLPSVSGAVPSDILLLPEAIRGIMRAMVKRALTPADLSAALNLPPDEAQQLADILVAKGFLQSQAQTGGNGVAYRVSFARTAHRDIPLDL